MQISKWVALGVAAFCLVAVGGVVNMPHLYYMASILVMLPIVSYALGWYSLRGMEFNREVPTMVWEGEETDIVYHARNSSRVARFFIAILEPDTPFAVSITMSPLMFNVQGQSDVRIVNRVRFDRRGVHSAGSFDVSAMDPLGVFTFTRTIISDDEIVVYPSPRTMEAVNLFGSEKLGWNDSNSIVRNGCGVDTSGVRGYLPGDPLRYIHWRQTARTGSLSVIEFEETQSVALHILLDTNSAGVTGEEPNTSLEYAIRFVANVARDAVNQGAAVDLVNPDLSRPLDDSDNGLAPMPHQENQLFGVLDKLARTEAQRSVVISDLAAASVRAVKRGTTLLIVCLYPDQDLTAVISRYIAMGVNVVVAFIDGSSFPQTGGILAEILNPPHNAAFQDVAATGIPVYKLQWNDRNVIRPVRYTEGQYA